MAELREILTKGTVIPLPHGSNLGFYCNLSLVTKVTWVFPPVINFKPLNQFVHNPHFKMETLQSVIKAVSRSDWSVLIDLTDAYSHVFIHLEHQHLLHFVVSSMEAYQFQALHFGLNSVP